MTLLDVRPGQLDVRFRPGNTVALELVFPDGTLADRTFAATLGEEDLDVDVAGDTITVSAAAEQTEDLSTWSLWALVETTGIEDQDLIVGRWSPSEHGTTSPEGAVSVVLDESTITVAVVGVPGPGLPAGGADDEILRKVGADDYDAEWVPLVASMISDLREVVQDEVGSPAFLADTATLDATYADPGNLLTLSVLDSPRLGGQLPAFYAAQAGLDDGLATAAAALTVEAGARADGDTVLGLALTAEVARATTAEGLLIPLAQKGAANGVATLDAGTLVPTVQLGGAGADATKFLRGDHTWAVVDLTSYAVDSTVVHKAGAETITGPKTFSVGGQSITAEAVGVIPLFVKGAAGQTANLFEVRDSTGAVQARIGPSGTATLNGIANPFNGNQLISASTAPEGFIGLSLSATTIAWVAKQSAANATVPVLLVKLGATPGAGGDAQQWQDSASAVLAKVTSAGDGYFAGSAMRVGLIGSFPGLVFGNGAWLVDTSTRLELWNHGFISAPGVAAKVPIIAQGAASQTADLQQWQKSTGLVMASIDALGELVIRPTTGGASPADAAAFIETRTSASFGVVVQGLASQTGDLQQWRDSAAAPRLVVDASGRLTTGTAFDLYIYGGGGANDLLINTISGRTTLIGGAGAASIRLIVKGAASQSASLQEWQNSAGAVQALMTVAGRLSLSSIADIGGGLLSFAAGGVTRAGVRASTGFEIPDGQDLWLPGTATGTKIGQATSKFAFYGGAPVVQGAAIADADGTLADLTTKFNALLARLRPTTGVALIAA